MISFTPLCYNVNTRYDVFYPTRWCLSGLAWDQRQGSVSCHRAQSSLPTSWQRVCVSTTPSPPWPVSPAMTVWLVRTKVVGFMRTVWEQRLLVLWEQRENKGCFVRTVWEQRLLVLWEQWEKKLLVLWEHWEKKVVGFYCIVYCTIWILSKTEVWFSDRGESQLQTVVPPAQ